MTSNLKIRPARVLVGAIFLLGFAVFFWGLQYKLSLYDLPGSPTRVAQAKLLSEKERPVTAQGAKLVSPRVPSFSRTIFSAFLIAAAYFSSQSIQLERMLQFTTQDVRHEKHYLSTFFSFRPPPVALRYN
jgi:hypothetical protein